MFKQNVMILISAILAIAVGYFFQDYSTEINKYVKPFGTIFLNLLLWMVVPFVFVSIILSISSLKDVKSVKNIGFYTVAYFLSTTVIAVLIGTIIALSCKSLFPAISKAAIGAEAHETATFSFMDAIVNLFPSNFIELFLKGNMIQIIVAAIFIGVAMVSLGRKSASVSRVVIELNMIFSAVLKTILKAAPVAVFFLLCPVVAEHGTHILGSIGAVVLVAYICYAVHALVIYSVMLMSFSKVGPVQFFKCMVPAMVFASPSVSIVALYSSTGKLLYQIIPPTIPSIMNNSTIEIINHLFALDLISRRSIYDKLCSPWLTFFSKFISSFSICSISIITH